MPCSMISNNEICLPMENLSSLQVILESGEIGRQANGAVLIRDGDTVSCYFSDDAHESSTNQCMYSMQAEICQPHYCCKCDCDHNYHAGLHKLNLTQIIRWITARKEQPLTMLPSISTSMAKLCRRCTQQLAATMSRHHKEALLHFL